MMKDFGRLAIRLSRQGCTNRPFYHIILIQKHKGLTAIPREQLGTLDPMPNSNGQKLCSINFERLKYWMSVGVQPTKPVEQLLGISGYLPIHPMTYITAKRNRKKLAEEELQKANKDNEPTEEQAQAAQ